MKKSTDSFPHFLKWVLPFCVLSLFTGFSHIEKVRVLEKDIDTPYQIMGTLEVKEKAAIFRPSDLVYGTFEILTLGFGKTPTIDEKLKSRLNKQLLVKARDHYGADAVIKVTYWPALKSESFPQGFVYARGLMVRYESFPVIQQKTENGKNPSLQTAAASNSDSPA